MLNTSDERLGRLLRTIRRRSGQRQTDLAKAARVPRRDVIRIEAGRAGEVDLNRLRALFEAAGGRAQISIWWNGAAADRLIDARHAALVERAVRVFRTRAWQTAVEVSFSEFGERGSIDILAGHPAARAIAVCEVKSALGSLEETNRVLDAKERLAPKLAVTRFGWTPSVVGRVLILPDDSTVRRIVARHALTMATIYPARSREVRAWLRRPDRPIRGVWFLSEVRDTDLVDG